MRLDLRPIGYVIGILLTLLGITMLIPMGIDFSEGRGFVGVFAESALITILTGSFLAIACSNGKSEGLDIQKTILLTTGVWVALPLFGSIPFIIGSTQLSFVDALFEAVSGVTTTGSTVLSGLEDLPKGILLWRGILQWLGGIGIIVVAMVFLPELRVGGMQIFRAEAFDTMGKILPRATTISLQIFVIYLGITIACALSYVAVGMSAFDAIVHSFTTVSTGGFSNYDKSFGHFSEAVEYVAIVFMIMAALPFVRYVQLVNGNSRAIFSDTQIKTFLVTTLVIATFAFFVLNSLFPGDWENAFRKALFNITSIISGTGYSSDNYMKWGGVLVSVIFFIGLIGGCAGSTTCSVKVFRYQLVASAILLQLRKIRYPHRVVVLKYDNRPVAEDVLHSVMTFFVVFFLSLGVLSILLSMTGLDLITSISGAVTALGNIGPGLGDRIGPSGNFMGLNDAAKWLLIIGMLVGRLELMAVYILFTRRFWRN